MNYPIICEHVFDKYIKSVKHRNAIEKQFRLAVTVLRIVLDDVVSSIDSNTCPYCKKGFKCRRSLFLHINKKHRDAYLSDIKYAVDCYIKVRSCLRKEQVKIVLDVKNHPKYRFVNMSDLSSFISRNKDIVFDAIR